MMNKQLLVVLFVAALMVFTQIEQVEGAPNEVPASKRKHDNVAEKGE